MSLPFFKPSKQIPRSPPTKSNSTPRKDKRTREESVSPEGSQPNKTLRSDEMAMLQQADLDKIRAMLSEVFDEKLQVLDKKCDDATSVAMSKIDFMRREKNIIISGLPEDNNEKITDQIKKAEGVFTKLGLKNIGIDDISRLGKDKKANGNPRPLLVKLVRKMDKRAIMSEKKKLGKEKIYINDDVSPAVRANEKKLRDKFREQKVLDKDYRMQIKRGELFIWKNKAVVKHFILDEATGDVELATNT
ncbi:unnamed protein product [Orchesella dallaii]|uniref:Uncharacterized protein n=1 Tax=Orchesella dallaii TaxID=48710 RepID=A0ABP1QA11_9HEXA